MPTVSIVIPALDEEENIGRALECVLAQSVSVDEVIVVDNGSTDRTRDIAASFAQRHHQIRVIDQPMPGVLAARTAGFDAATGDILARIDADSRLRPTWVAQVLTTFADKPNVDGVTGPTPMYDSPFAAKTEAINAKMQPGPSKNLLGNNMAIRACAWRAVRHIEIPTTVHEDLALAALIDRHCGDLWFEPSVIADVSPRRMLMAPWDNFRYALASLRTVRRYRNWRDFVVKCLTLPIELTLQGVMCVLWRAWDGQRSRFSLRQLARPVKRRASPV